MYGKIYIDLQFMLHIFQLESPIPPSTMHRRASSCPDVFHIQVSPTHDVSPGT